MTINSRLNAFLRLGHLIYNLSKDELEEVYESAYAENKWFTRDNVQMALEGISRMLQEERLISWFNSYHIIEGEEKTIGIVMAGNIPLVGFHDLLCVLLAGHKAKVKLSSQDSYLIRYVVELLEKVDPEVAGEVQFVDFLKSIDAVIATGSDNSSRYFEHYFGKYPHIIRKNRTSVAVLDGTEEAKELQDLGRDVFSYFGLGCRNVSKLYVPANYDFEPMLNAWSSYHEVSNHSKYANNYDYNKAIYLVEKMPFLDSGFVMLVESDELVSPTSVVYYEYYKDQETLDTALGRSNEKIQVVVSKNEKYGGTAFGCAQLPGPEDYADNVDTLRFLTRSMQ